MNIRRTAGFLAFVFFVLCLPLGLARPAEARRRRASSAENAWRIGTYVGAAGTAAALATGKGTWALIGAGATLLSYSQWKREMKKRHRRASYANYRAYRTAYARRHHRRHR